LPDTPDGRVWAVVANVREPGGCLRNGARAVVLYMPGDGERVLVSALSRGGRRIESWLPIARLKNARVRQVPDRGKLQGYSGRTPEEAAALIAAAGGQP